MATATKISNEALFVSEPNPVWFGNPANTPEDSAWTNPNWLKSRFHTNFAEHRGGRDFIGSMRVCNDDLVQPHRGFGTHPHSNAEIVTYIIDGELTHQDSMGTAETLGRGAVQFMTAGSGIRHSEHNLGDRPLRFIQMWFTPSERSLQPNYGSFVGDAQMRSGNLHHIVSNVRGDVATPVQINQDVNIYAAELKPGEEVKYDLKPGRMGYLLNLEGAGTCTTSSGAVHLQQHDAAELHGTGSVSLHGKGKTGSHVLLIEMHE